MKHGRSRSLLKLTLAVISLIIMVSSIGIALAADLPHVGQITKPMIKMRINHTCDGSRYTCLLPPGTVDCFVNLDYADNITKACKIGDVD